MQTKELKELFERLKKYADEEEGKVKREISALLSEKKLISARVGALHRKCRQNAMDRLVEEYSL